MRHPVLGYQHPIIYLFREKKEKEKLGHKQKQNKKTYR